MPTIEQAEKYLDTNGLRWMPVKPREADDALLRCPFCASHDVSYLNARCICLECGAQGPSFGPFVSDPRRAWIEVSRLVFKKDCE
jgi:hypothetical protein